MLNILLILGLAVDPSAPSVAGTCRGLEDKPVRCVMTKQPYGIMYVYTGESVYRFRPVWKNVYSVIKDSQPVPSAICNQKGDDLLCLNKFSFISDL